MKLYKVLTVKFENEQHQSYINPSDISDKKLSKSSGEVVFDEKKTRFQEIGLLLKNCTKLLEEPAQSSNSTSLIVIDCPQCKAKLRLPDKLNLDVTCPKCQHSWQKRRDAEQGTNTALTIRDQVTTSVDGLLKQAEQKAGRILFQRLFIQGIEAYKVEYSKGGTSGKPIWIYGKEKQVFTTGTPPLDWRKVSIVSALAAGALIFLAILIVSSIPSKTYQPEQPTQSQSQPQTVVVSKGATVRQGPGTNFPAVATLKKGQTVMLLSDVQTSTDGGTWEKVKIDNIEGYVNQKLLKK